MLSRALATLTLEQLQAEQSACLSAYLKLSRGAAHATISHNDNSVTYARADLKQLSDLLNALDRAIAAKTGDTTAPRRRPLHPVL